MHNTIKMWLVLQNQDTTEGRGPMLFKGVFSTEDNLRTWVNGQPMSNAAKKSGMDYYDYIKAGKDGGWSMLEFREITVDVLLNEKFIKERIKNLEMEVHNLRGMLQ